MVVGETMRFSGSEVQSFRVERFSYEPLHLCTSEPLNL